MINYFLSAVVVLGVAALLAQLVLDARDRRRWLLDELRRVSRYRYAEVSERFLEFLNDPRLSRYHEAIIAVYEGSRRFYECQDLAGAFMLARDMGHAVPSGPVQDILSAAREVPEFAFLLIDHGCAMFSAVMAEASPRRQREFVEWFKQTYRPPEPTRAFAVASAYRAAAAC